MWCPIGFVFLIVLAAGPKTSNFSKPRAKVKVVWNLVKIVSCFCYKCQLILMFCMSGWGQGLCFSETKMLRIHENLPRNGPRKFSEKVFIYPTTPLSEKGDVGEGIQFSCILLLLFRKKGVVGEPFHPTFFCWQWKISHYNYFKLGYYLISRI